MGSVAEAIPMPVIGGLIFVIGAELIVGRLPDIKLVLRTGVLLSERYGGGTPCERLSCRSRPRTSSCTTW